MKAGVDLAACGDLRAVRALGTTGSPLVRRRAALGHRAVRAASATPDIWWCNISGGTDFAGAFIGGNRELPQVPGEMQCRLLGCAVEAWNEQGQPVIDEVGELVCTQPMPSMPLYFWGDEGNKRYLSSLLRHLPRRLAPRRLAEDHAARAAASSTAAATRPSTAMACAWAPASCTARWRRLPEVLDSMVVDLEYLGRESYMPLFVVLRARRARWTTR